MLKEGGVDVRVVSMPSMELFDKQDESYKESVLNVPYERRISVEVLSTFGWGKYAKTNMGIDSFGASAPMKDVFRKFDFSKERLVRLAKQVLNK